MKRLILICAVLLLAQTGLVMLTHWTRQGAEIQTGKGPLLKLTGGRGQRTVARRWRGPQADAEEGEQPMDLARIRHRFRQTRFGSRG